MNAQLHVHLYMYTCAQGHAKPCFQAYGATAISTIKLHLALHHIGDQMATHGSLDKLQEYWIERMVGYVTDSIHGNSKVHPEATFSKVHLTRSAVIRCRCDPLSL